MNFVFVSPHFPDSYYRFCRGLKNNGVNVLGIADVPYDYLPQNVKDSLCDYYYVHSLENYDEKTRALGYFISKYGHIDFLESNNEYWLESDSWLRTDFNIFTGPKSEDIKYFRYKSLMKEKYKLANVKTARYHLVENEEDTRAFVKEVGFPLIVKPDDGVGAGNTHKLKNEADLDNFLKTKDPHVKFIMEEFIKGELISFDGVCDSKGRVAFPTHHVFPTPIMDVVNEDKDVFYYTNKEIPQDLYDAGQRVLLAFGAKSRFYHLEFFRLTEDKKGLGKKGDLIGLEVNMRAPGGYTPDMINFAYSCDIYQIWADVMAFDEVRHAPTLEKQYCCYCARRFDRAYKHSIDEILEKYKQICFYKDNPKVLSGAMGDYFFMCRFVNKDDMDEYIKFILEK